MLKRMAFEVEVWGLTVHLIQAAGFGLASSGFRAFGFGFKACSRG